MVTWILPAFVRLLPPPGPWLFCFLLVNGEGGDETYQLPGQRVALSELELAMHPRPPGEHRWHLSCEAAIGHPVHEPGSVASFEGTLPVPPPGPPRLPMAPRAVPWP